MEINTRGSSKQLLPRVSIVIVNYNGYRWLKMFVPHLVETLYPDFEIIVVDNASLDESVQFLKENFGGIKVVELHDNKGFAEGSNIGASYSKGEVLAFLNNDIEVSDDWLINAVSKLISDDTVAVVQCKIMRYDDRKKIDCVGLSVDRYNFFRIIGHSELDIDQYGNLEEIGACTGGAMVIWKHVFYEVGCFDSTYFMYYEDVDLSWRIRLAGYRICPCPSSVVYHVGSGSSNINSSDRWKPSPFFAFLSSRNNVYCWLKNSRLKTIIICWPVFLFGNVIIGLLLIPTVSSAAGIAYFKGLFWPIIYFRYILKQRKMTKHIIKKREDNILFVGGIIGERSNFANIVKGAPSRLKQLIRK